MRYNANEEIQQSMYIQQAIYMVRNNNTIAGE